MRILMTGCCSGFGVHVRNQLIEQGHSVWGVGLDGPNYVRDFNGSMDSLVAKVESVFQDLVYPMDVLINNAGTMYTRAFHTYPIERFDEALKVNLMAPFLFMQRFLHQDLDGRGSPARIINITSFGMKRTPRECSGYVASKAGLEFLTRSVAAEYALCRKLVVCSIAPYTIDDTPMQRQGIRHMMQHRGLTEAQAEEYMTPPTGRRITHDEIWNVFDFAVNSMPHAMTGTSLTIPCGTGM